MSINSKFMKRHPRAVVVGVASIAVAGVLLAPGTASAATITSNSTGMDGGCYYSFWTDTAGSTKMVTNGNGNYQMTWNNTNNQVGGLGWRNGNANQVVNYSGTFNSPGNGYLALYGWTRNPLVEYYVVDSWGSWKPPGSSSRGTVTSDGGTYDIFITDRVNQPSIEGTSTFKQYWSVRQSKRVGGTITVRNHFDAWAKFGLQLGTHDYMIMATEGYQSSGSSNITVNCGGGSPSVSSSNNSGTVTATVINSSSTTTTNNSGGGGCTASWANAESWGDRFNGRITVSGASNWTVTIGLGANQNIINSWSANVSGTSGTVTATSNGNSSFGITIQDQGQNRNQPSLSCRAG
jgi:endo-1,4-beta-xylanase